MWRIKLYFGRIFGFSNFHNFYYLVVLKPTIISKFHEFSIFWNGFSLLLIVFEILQKIIFLFSIVLKRIKYSNFCNFNYLAVIKPTIIPKFSEFSVFWNRFSLSFIFIEILQKDKILQCVSIPLYLLIQMR